MVSVRAEGQRRLYSLERESLATVRRWFDVFAQVQVEVSGDGATAAPAPATVFGESGKSGAAG